MSNFWIQVVFNFITSFLFSLILTFKFNSKLVYFFITQEMDYEKNIEKWAKHVDLGLSKKTGYPVLSPDLVRTYGSRPGTSNIGSRTGSKFLDPVKTWSGSG